MSETPQPQPTFYDPRAKLAAIIEALRLPAGPDPRFADHESIKAHRDDFVVRVHTTWKGIHAAAIREIVEIEILLTRPDVAKMPKGFVSWLRYLCRVWRRVSDAIAWSLVAEPLHIRRLCAHRPRPALGQSNPFAVAALLDDINKDPMSIALWNDATTCIDVGDITVRRGSGQLEYIELKEGKVNEAVLDLHATVTQLHKAGDSKGVELAMDAFFEKYGKKGNSQAMRIARQMTRDSKVMNLITLEEGPDPDLDVDVKTFAPTTIVESYEAELTACLRRAEADDTAITCIDGCLWIYVVHDRVLTREQAVADFSREVFKARPETKVWVKERTGRDVLHPVESVDNWSFEPTAIPIFLRPLAVDDVLDLVYGKFLGRVLLFFDWLGFEEVVRETGCALTWVKPKPVAGHHLEQIVGKRTPRIGGKDGHGMRLGGLLNREVTANGIRPRSIAAQYAEIITGLGAG
jgi:hypothetical protein